MAEQGLTAERLRELLHYDPLTGEFTRRIAVGRHGRHKAGDVVGCLSYGYTKIGIDGKRYQAQRLAWLYVHSAWPPHLIDHVNGDMLDNRIANLRLATPSENQQNRHGLQVRNTSGVTGVQWLKEREQWYAEIMINRERKRLGSFDTKEAAIEARSRAEKIFHPFKQGHQ